MTARINREDWYMELCHVLRKRSTCKRGKVGALAVVDGRIVATSYNGAPPGAPHCLELGCDVPENNHEAGCQRSIHAEANLIAFAARHGVELKGSDVFCTHSPCFKCAQLIVAAGIATITYETPYRIPTGLELLDSLNVPAHQHVWAELDFDPLKSC